MMQDIEEFKYLQADWLDTDDAAKHAHKLDDCQAVCKRAPMVLQPTQNDTQ
jgi:hypothetical protein